MKRLVVVLAVLVSGCATAPKNSASRGQSSSAPATGARAPLKGPGHSIGATVVRF